MNSTANQVLRKPAASRLSWSAGAAIFALLLASVLPGAPAGVMAADLGQALGSISERLLAQLPSAAPEVHADRQVAGTQSIAAGRPAGDEYNYAFANGPLAVVSGTVAVNQTGGFTLLAEGNGTDTYSIVLSAAPTSDVSVAVGDGLPFDAVHQVLFTTELTTTASNTAYLTFTSTNYYTAQTVTIRAVDDTAGEGRHAVVISARLLTSSPNYVGVVVPSFTAEVQDNDAALLLAQTDASTELVEAGAIDTYFVSLSTQPTNTVVVIPGGVSPAQFSYSPTSVTFSTTNYDVPQLITVTAMDDSTVEGYHTSVITHSVTGYDNLPSPYPFTNREQAAPTSITANINDNDSNVLIIETGNATHTVRFGETLTSIALQYGVTLQALLEANPGVTAESVKVGDLLQVPATSLFRTSTTVREGGGVTDTYSIRLRTAPTGYVSVTLGDGMYVLQIQPSGTDPGYLHDVTFATAGTTTATSTVTLTFTPANYATAQIVSVTAYNDTLKEGVEKVSITHHVRSVSNTGSSDLVTLDSSYNATPANRVLVTVLDNDLGTATLAADFDGDGKTDYAIFRATTAQFFVKKSTDSSTEVVTWGNAAMLDRPVPADYDGDGKTDYAVYRPATAQFFVKQSSTGAAEVVTWGIAGGGDIPAVGDYDADGRTDYAIFRKSSAQFFVKNSASGAAAVVVWGSALGGDTPVVADYDGDGMADYAVYRKFTSQWFIKQSSNAAVTSITWGARTSADIPVPGDYDGDGKTDHAVYRPETAQFFVRQSTDASASVTNWGIAGGGDIPVPGDYDGDGKLDKAIFRPSSATFIVQKSSTLTPIDPPTTWGVAGSLDYPLPVPDTDSNGTVYGFITAP